MSIGCRCSQAIPNTLLDVTCIKPRTEECETNKNQLPHLRRIQIVAQRMDNFFEQRLSVHVSHHRRSNTAAKNPSVPWTCGSMTKYGAKRAACSISIDCARNTVA